MKHGFLSLYLRLRNNFCRIYSTIPRNRLDKRFCNHLLRIETYVTLLITVYTQLLVSDEDSMLVQPKSLTSRNPEYTLEGKITALW